MGISNSNCHHGLDSSQIDQLVSFILKYIELGIMIFCLSIREEKKRHYEDALIP